MRGKPPTKAAAAKPLDPPSAPPPAHGGFTPPLPFLGAIGMMPACPNNLATVSDGCAPTDNQYLFARWRERER